MNKRDRITALQYILFDLGHKDFIRLKDGNEVDKNHRKLLEELATKELKRLLKDE